MSIFILFLGFAVGSFLSVLADRLALNEDVIIKPSHCDFCKHRLSSLDLVPILSFIFLKGRCRYCKHKISLKHPLVELTTGLGFLLIYRNVNFFTLPSPAFITLIFLFILFSVFLVITLSDLRYFIIPDSMLFIGSIAVAVFKIFFERDQLVASLITALIASLFFYFLHLVTKGKGMGLGDVKYAFLMGFLLSFPATIIAFYLAFLTGAAIGVILILIGNAKLKSRIPFGPFLILATVITFIWKDQLTSIFLKMLM